jgi:hypothetical protein
MDNVLEGNTTPLDVIELVNVFEFGQQISIGPKYLGSFRIGESGFTTKRSYEDVVSEAQKQAYSMGGNILVITQHKKPNFWYSGHRIVADVYLKK